eukprot:gene7983-5821_t
MRAPAQFNERRGIFAARPGPPRPAGAPARGHWAAAAGGPPPPAAEQLH